MICGLVFFCVLFLPDFDVEVLLSSKEFNLGISPECSDPPGLGICCLQVLGISSLCSSVSGEGPGNSVHLWAVSVGRSLLSRTRPADSSCLVS